MAHYHAYTICYVIDENETYQACMPALELQIEGSTLKEASAFARAALDTHISDLLANAEVIPVESTSPARMPGEYNREIVILAIEPHPPAPAITTTLYDLVDTIQQSEIPDHDTHVAQLVQHILKAGRARWKQDSA